MQLSLYPFPPNAACYARTDSDNQTDNALWYLVKIFITASL